MNVITKRNIRMCLRTSVEAFLAVFFIIEKCCSGKSVLLPTRTFSSLQHVFDRKFFFCYLLRFIK